LQAETDQDVVDKKRKADVTRKAAQERLDAITPRLDVANILEAPGTNTKLDLQLDWHR
jgi:hypothetical protein